jgi:hypothetical protein
MSPDIFEFKVITLTCKAEMYFKSVSLVVARLIPHNSAFGIKAALQVNILAMFRKITGYGTKLKGQSPTTRMRIFSYLERGKGVASLYF